MSNSSGTAGTVRRSIELLDCTLREGAYAVNFQVSAEMIENVLARLEGAGVTYIELGHGWGLNGHTVSRPAEVSNDECCVIAGRVLKKATWGMFCVPGIGRIEDLERAADGGMRFVRIGTNITQTERAESFIHRARELGMFVCMNLMKTQTLDDDGVLQVAKRCEGYGADAIYLVDSVGSMLPDTTTALVSTVSNGIGVPVGFHGHDNFGLANANSLAAVRAGAAFVDATLDGMGRSAGNAVTESLSVLLRRANLTDAYNGFQLARTSEELIQTLDRLSDSRYMQLVGAYSNLHSSYFPMIQSIAADSAVDLADLMIGVGEVDSVDPSAELVLATAKQIAARNGVPV